MAALSFEHLVVEDQPCAEDIRFLDERITEFNLTQTGIRDVRDLAIFLRDEQGAIAAGVSGWTWGGSLAVKYLWVREDWRGQGHGTRLLRAAEAEALRRGCTQAFVDTHSFQAPELYQGLGYVIYGVLKDHPRGHQQLFLRKKLERR